MEDYQEKIEHKDIGLKQKNDKKAKGFRAFNISHNLVEAIKKIGYKFPTPIQRKAIPQIISGFNVIAHSRTGSGKTAAFLIPILNRLKEHSKIVGTRCLIISPTRELAHQTLSFCKKLGKFTNLKYALLVGGNEFEGQFEKLAQNPDIIIATPGRVVHHLTEGSLSLKKIEILVVDEADKLFELNFEEQINYILKSCPPSRQVILFSATIPQQLAQFMKTGIREYKLLNLDEESKIPDKLKIHNVTCRYEDKKYALLALLKNVIKRDQSTLIFVPTKYHCEFLNEFLKYWNIYTLYIYGQMDMELRIKNLENFKKRYCNLLIVTDVAARGLDIPFLDNVINYDFPDTVKLFIHRIGRTARADKEGRVINILSPNDYAFFFDFKPTMGRQIILSYSNDNVINKDLLNKSLHDFGTVSFGSIPISVINELKDDKVEHLNNKIDVDLLEDTASKAMGKSLSFKQKPSRYGIKMAKKLNYIETHPFFFDRINNVDELEKQNFLNQIKNFKPKESYFERVNETNVKEEVIKQFKTQANEYKRKKELEKIKEKMREENEEEYEEEQYEDKNSQEKEHKLLGKKVKRSQIRNFKNNPHYVVEKPDKSKSLWGDEKPLSLDELTLNIVPDNENQLKKKKLVWDPKKKNFVKAATDRKGNIIKTNEAGVKVKKDDKDPKLFQKWKKKNQIKSMPRTGDLENEKIIEKVSMSFKDRKAAKRTNPKGAKNELKSFNQLLKQKKDQFKKTHRKNFSKKDAKVRQIKDQAHLNRRSQAMIIRRRKK